ncbi:MAG: membrane dipeptidase [Candidatus Aminicenantes bacterium]|nr:membrane dipeptidase [Candidatus Aminicenantes bacterium]
MLLIPASQIDAKKTHDLDQQLWKKALKIHDEAVVIDTHCDTPMAILERKIDLGQKTTATEVDFIKMKEGGVDASFFAVFVSNRLDKKNPSKRALEMIDEIYRQVENNPHLAEIACSPAGIKRIEGTGKRAILIGMENGGPIEGSLRLLRNYYRLGVRYITLTHSGNNDICDSSGAKKPQWNGLSEFGEKVVAEMNRLGMIIDVSHVSDEAFWDVLKISKAPVFASHSCVRAICDSPRNLTDEMIKALARSGGIVHLNFYAAFLDDKFRVKSDAAWEKVAPERKKLREKYKDDRNAYWNAIMGLWKKYGPPAPKIDTLMEHIDHIVKLVGVDHVGMGSDYDGAGAFPQGLEDVSGFPLITYHLLKRGYKEEDIKKILGGNFLRFFDKVIATGKTL